MVSLQEDTDVFGDSNVDKEWRKVFAQGVNEMRGLNAAPISPDQCDIRALDPKRLMSLKQVAFSLDVITLNQLNNMLTLLILCGISPEGKFPLFWA